MNFQSVHNRRFRVVSCYSVVHPEEFRVRSVDLLEDAIQQVAIQRDRARRGGQPPYGELSFKHFHKPTGYEVHAFFINKVGKKVRFMKTAETDEVPFA